MESAVAWLGASASPRPGRARIREEVDAADQREPHEEGTATQRGLLAPVPGHFGVLRT
jgi:hypothetical protein